MPLPGVLNRRSPGMKLAVSGLYCAASTAKAPARGINPRERMNE
jgi:hypothetical protein